MRDHHSTLLATTSALISPDWMPTIQKFVFAMAVALCSSLLTTLVKKVFDRK